MSPCVFKSGVIIGEAEGFLRMYNSKEAHLSSISLRALLKSLLKFSTGELEEEFVKLLAPGAPPFTGKNIGTLFLTFISPPSLFPQLLSAGQIKREMI